MITSRSTVLVYVNSLWYPSYSRGVGYFAIHVTGPSALYATSLDTGTPSVNVEVGFFRCHIAYRISRMSRWRRLPEVKENANLFVYYGAFEAFTGTHATSIIKTMFDKLLARTSCMSRGADIEEKCCGIGTGIDVS